MIVIFCLIFIIGRGCVMIIIPELNRFFTLEDFSRRLWRRRRRRHSNAIFFFGPGL